MSFEQQGANRAAGLISSEDRFDKISGDMCKCHACFCQECGCASPMDPCLLSDFKILCCKGNSHSGGEMSGPKGMCANYAKCCCLVQGCSMPFVCTVCNTDLMGSPQRTPDEADDAWMSEVFWIIYCCCHGCGVTGGLEPWVHQDSKMCCLEGQARTTEMGGDGGCCHSRAKQCCLVVAEECPPTMDIGLACCGIKCVGGNPEVGEARAPAVVAPSQMEMK